MAEPVFSGIDPTLFEQFPEVYKNEKLSEGAKTLFTIINTYVTETRDDIPRMIEKYYGRIQDELFPNGWEAAANELSEAGFLPNWLNTWEVRQENRKKMLLDQLEKAHQMLSERFKTEDFDEEDQYLLIALLNHRVFNLKRQSYKLRQSGNEDAGKLSKEWFHLEGVLVGDLGCKNSSAFGRLENPSLSERTKSPFDLG